MQIILRCLGWVLLGLLLCGPATPQLEVSPRGVAVAGLEDLVDGTLTDDTMPLSLTAAGLENLAGGRRRSPEPGGIPGSTRLDWTAPGRGGTSPALCQGAGGFGRPHSM